MKTILTAKINVKRQSRTKNEYGQMIILSRLEKEKREKEEFQAILKEKNKDFNDQETRKLNKSELETTRIKESRKKIIENCKRYIYTANLKENGEESKISNKEANTIQMLIQNPDLDMLDVKGQHS